VERATTRGDDSQPTQGASGTIQDVERATTRGDDSQPTQGASGTIQSVERATTRGDGPTEVANAASVRVRAAVAGDAEATREIYNVEVLESTVTFDLVPRGLEEQRRWLAEHAGGHPALVAVDGSGSVVGFGSLSPYRSRPAYSTTVEDSVYVHRDHRGRGVGRALLDELVVRARAHGFHTVIARVVGGHAASIALHEACGFEVVGTARQVGRKFNRWLDVVELQLLL
jgi:phosphinothricin acetyltransferase